ncbi:hypothetical protein MJO28_007225, partial [Puccinia striiformis f. sp. tritici]
MLANPGNNFYQHSNRGESRLSRMRLLAAGALWSGLNSGWLLGTIRMVNHSGLQCYPCSCSGHNDHVMRSVVLPTQVLDHLMQGKKALCLRVELAAS